MYLVSILVQHPIYKISKDFLYYSEKEVKLFVRVEINFNKQITYGFVTKVEYKDENIKQIEALYGFKIKEIGKIIDEEPIVSTYLFNLAESISKRYLYPLIGVLQTMLPPSLRPQKSSKNESQISYITYYKLKDNIDLKLLSKAQLKLIEQFKVSKFLTTKDVASKKTSFNYLLKNNYLETFKEEKFRYNIKKSFEYETEITLSEEQNKVYLDVIKSSDHVYLLKGITGSGKTEIYIKLVENTLKNGKTALILVPEIGLTPLMISRILAIFPSKDIAVLHSSLTSGAIYDEYRKIRDGKVKIVIGTRSAIFAPLENLGIVIIDEEHDESYKQDSGLTYNAKDIAILRCKKEDAKLILGSSTPSIETMSKAINGNYHLLELNKRYNEATIPSVLVVDRNKRENFSYNSSIFSLELIKEIKDRISKNEQTILLINNRGYARSYYCRECGHVFICPTCKLPLVYHKDDDTLRCHHCEYKVKRIKTCPECGSTFLGFNGFGIEKVEEDFTKIFNEKYLLLDGDRTKKSLQITGILKDFDEKKALVLIGTQVVAKGHDFKDVTLVGILNCDTSLNLPSYRAKEMTFSLLTQAIGRCGRKEKNGLAIIQTSQINNYSIICAAKQDYNSFYNYEINERKILRNPPFFNLISLTIEGNDIETCDEYSNNIKKSLLIYEKVLYIYGPGAIYFKKNHYAVDLYLKSKILKESLNILSDLVEVYKGETKIRIIININPYN